MSGGEQCGTRYGARYSTLASLLLLVLGTACVPGDLRPPGVGDAAPHFEAISFKDNSTVSLADYAGEVVLVNLWATWCGPCRFETPYLQEIYEENQEAGLRLVGISVDSEGSLDAVAYFLEENGVTYDILLDPDMVSTDVFAAIGLPATFLIDQEGIIRFKKLGPILEGDPDFLEALEHALD